ncbi:MAG: DUF4340 domain-containing protein [Polyangiales bacterium]
MSRTAAVALLLIAALFGGGILVFERGSSSTKERLQSEGRLFSMRADDVTSVQIEATQQLEFARTTPKDIWTSPNSPAASNETDVPVPQLDQQRVAAFVDLWLFALPLRRLGPATEPELVSFDLKNASKSIRFSSPESHATLLLGKKETRGQGVYARFDDSNEVYVISDALAESLSDDFFTAQTDEHEAVDSIIDEAGLTAPVEP